MNEVWGFQLIRLDLPTMELESIYELYIIPNAHTYCSFLVKVMPASGHNNTTSCTQTDGDVPTTPTSSYSSSVLPSGKISRFYSSKLSSIGFIFFF